MQKFFAAIATLWGRPSNPGATATGESEAPTEPAIDPAGDPAPAIEPARDPVTPVLSPAIDPAGNPAPARGPRGKRRGTAPERTCPWCSAGVRAADATCPSCGATLDTTAVEGVAIPGLTELEPNLRRYAEDVRAGKKRRQILLKMIFNDAPDQAAVDAPQPSDADALRPPSAAVRAEMARFETDSDEDVETPPPGDEEAVAPDPAAPAAPSLGASDPAGGEERT